jgi:hypothetical protein
VLHRRRARRPTAAPELLAGAPAVDEAGRPVRIQVLGREGCHLCEVAREVVADVARTAGVGWTERDVTESEELLRRYAELVPVVFVDGTEHARFRVDPVRLRAELRRRRRWSR